MVACWRTARGWARRSRYVLNLNSFSILYTEHIPLLPRVKSSRGDEVLPIIHIYIYININTYKYTHTHTYIYIYYPEERDALRRRRVWYKTNIL